MYGRTVTEADVIAESDVIACDHVVPSPGDRRERRSASEQLG